MSSVGVVYKVPATSHGLASSVSRVWAVSDSRVCRLTIARWKGTSKGFSSPTGLDETVVTVPRVNRKIRAGKYPILDVFPGLDGSKAFRNLFDDGLRERVLRECQIHVVAEDMYMYIDDEAGNVVAGLGYLKTGEERIVYLDVLHELTHIRQWHAGKELWDRRYNYVDRPTEIEAYQVAVEEARRLGMTDREIADYLRVEWTSREEHERLCQHLGVRSPESRAV